MGFESFGYYKLSFHLDPRPSLTARVIDNEMCYVPSS